MVDVIGKDINLKKNTTCRGCASLLSYLPNDVKEEWRTDYTGGVDRYTFIVCPCCSKEVYV